MCLIHIFHDHTMSLRNVKIITNYFLPNVPCQICADLTRLDRLPYTAAVNTGPATSKHKNGFIDYCPAQLRDYFRCVYNPRSVCNFSRSSAFSSSSSAALSSFVAFVPATVVHPVARGHPTPQRNM